MDAELALEAVKTLSEAPGLSVYWVLLGMAGATYFTRAAGLFLISRVAPTPRVEAFLRHVPASILVAIVVPSLVQGGPAERIAALATALVAILTRSLISALSAGVLAVVLLRGMI